MPTDPLVDLWMVKGKCYFIQGKLDEAFHAYETASRKVSLVKDRTNQLPRQGRIAARLGATYYQREEYEKAIDYQKEALRIRRILDDQIGIANAYHDIGWSYYRLGSSKYKLARARFKSSEQIARDHGDKLLQGRAILGLGTIDWAADQKMHEEARKQFDTSLEIFRECGDRGSEARAEGNLGLFYQDMEQLDKAVSHYQKAIAIDEQIGDVADQLIGLSNLGYVNYQRGAYTDSIKAYERLIVLVQDLGRKQGLCLAHSGLAEAYLALKDSQQALKYAELAHDEASTERELGISSSVLGWVWLENDDPNQAKRFFEQAIPYLEAVDEIEDLVKARRGIKEALSQLSNIPDSEKGYPHG